MKYPAVEKILAATGQAEIDSVTLSYMTDKHITTDEEWAAWDEAKEQVFAHIIKGMGDSAEDPESDEMAGMISITVLVHMKLDATELPADLVPKFDTLCREAFAQFFP